MTKPTTEPLDPSLVPKPKDIYVHKDDIERVLMNKLPGYIADMSRGAQWPGCRIVTFGYGYINGLTPEMKENFTAKLERRHGDIIKLAPAVMMNDFFEFYANHYLAGWGVSNVGITAMYSTILDEEDSADLQEISQEIRKAMNAKRAERAAAQAEAAAKAKAEHDEIMALGKKAKDHNLLEKLKEQEQEIKTLKQNLKAAKRS